MSRFIGNDRIVWGRKNDFDMSDYVGIWNNRIIPNMFYVDDVRFEFEEKLPSDDTIHVLWKDDDKILGWLCFDVSEKPIRENGINKLILLVKSSSFVLRKNTSTKVLGKK